MKTDTLREYLETGKSAEAIVQDAAIVVASESSPMEDLLKHIAATAMVAKDLHYKAKGKPFLANHELADMIADIEEHKDTINEVYYMGEQQSNPPLSTTICGGAVDIVKGLYGENMSPDENILIGNLHSLCMHDIDLVERVKELGVKSGTQAALDEISKDSMQYAGFLKNVLSGTATDIDADATTDGIEEPVVAEEVVAIGPKDTDVAEASIEAEEPTDGDDDDSIEEETEVVEDEPKTNAQKYMSIVNGN